MKGRLTKNSENILSKLKDSLSSHRTTFDNHILDVLGYYQTKLTFHDLCSVIKHYDPIINNLHIKQLYSELQDSYQQCVLTNVLSQLVETNQEHPKNNSFNDSFSLNLSQFFKESNSKMINSIHTSDKGFKPKKIFGRQSTSKSINTNSIKNLKSKEQIQKVLNQLKDLILIEGNPQQLIKHFTTYVNQTHINVIGLKGLMQSCNFNNQEKQQLVIQILFNQKQQVTLEQFIQVLDSKNHSNFDLSQLSFDQSLILGDLYENQLSSKTLQLDQISSQHIQKIRSDIFYSKKIVSGIYQIDKIPKPILPYFNYGSELQEQFAKKSCYIIKNNEIFFDQNSPIYNKAYKYVHVATIIPDYNLFVKADSIIQRQSSRKGLAQILQPKDIRQGMMGNCYFLSAIAAIVQSYPQLVYRLFVLERNPSHIFGVRLFIEGKWETIQLDGRFPMNRYSQLCCAQPHHHQIWVMLLQKAWAKIFGSYDIIYSGYNEQGLVSLSGAPVIIHSSKRSNFITNIKQQFERGAIINCSTSKYINNFSEQQLRSLGLVSEHAYTILKIFKLKINQDEITLLKMRNPWGRRVWKGDWSFDSQKWTPQLRQLTKYKKNYEDGTFFISLTDFIKYFDNVNVSRVNLGYVNSFKKIDKAQRSLFYCLTFTITQPGEYYFTIYQQNKKKYKNTAIKYEKSQSWIYLIQNRDKADSIKIISIHAGVYRDNTVHANLQYGDYRLICKVKWNHWQQHFMNISSYGPSKIYFSPEKVVHNQFINKIIQAHCKQIQRIGKEGKLLRYEEFNITRMIYFHASQSLGFICIKNNDKVILDTKISLQSQGVQALPPYKLPLQAQIKPGQKLFCCFNVNPKNFSYKIQQKYRIFEQQNTV